LPLLTISWRQEIFPFIFIYNAVYLVLKISEIIPDFGNYTLIFLTKNCKICTYLWLSFRKYLLITGVVLAGNLFLTPCAVAACTFEEFNSGELVGVGSPLANSLVSSGVSGSASVEVAVNCNFLGGRLIVLPPVQTTGNVTVPGLATVTNLSNNQSINSLNSLTLILPPGRTVLKVDMSVNNVTPLRPGNYQYRVPLQFIL
jgi:hypothetical protein